MVYYRPPDVDDLNIDSLKNDPNFKLLDYEFSCLNLLHLPFKFSRLNKTSGRVTLIDHVGKNFKKFENQWFLETIFGKF